MRRFLTLGSGVLVSPAALLVVGLLVAPAASASTEPEVTEVVQFAAGLTLQERSAAVERAGGTVAELADAGDYALVGLTPSQAATLAASPEVLGVESPVRLRALAAPNDPAYRVQWALPAVQAEQAWASTTGTGTVVAVLDTGVAAYAGQPTPVVRDLAGTSLLAGYDFVDDDTVPQDLNGHGTFVTGVLAATTNDGHGAAGLAYGTSILPVRVLAADGSGTDFQVARGIRYAVDRKADVINLSLGGATSSAVLRDAVGYAVNAGVVVVAASGNDGASTISYPAAYAGVLAVGATGRYGMVAPYSNRGPSLALMAPGGVTTQDLDGDGYVDGVLQETLDPRDRSVTCLCFEQGTSFAAPLVAAAAAMVQSVGLRDAASVRDVLTATAKDLGPTGTDPTYGAGLLQVADALSLARQRLAKTAPQPTGSPATTPTPSPQPTTAPTPAPAPSRQGAALTPTDGTARSTAGVCPTDRVPSGRYPDVDPTSVHAAAVDCLAWYGISQGRSDGRYDPRGTVTRAQMASFLVRELDAAGVQLATDVPDAFADDDADAHESAINRLAAAGVVRGRTDGTYGPGEPVARGAMATFLMRTYPAATGTVLVADTDAFLDDDGSAHESAIDAAARYGLATGTGPGRYSPDVAVQRDQMASFLTRLLAALGEVGDVPQP